MPPGFACGLLEFEGFTLDLDRECLQAGERLIDLRPKSFDVLRLLVENAGRLVYKDELIKTLWPGVFVEDDALTHCISEVRRALDDQERRIIRTVPRRGYLFVPSVLHRETHGAATVPTAPPAREAESPANLGSLGASAAGQAVSAETAGSPTERRHLTAMRCEFVGMAALSTRLDPEDLHRIMSAAHRRFERVVARHHGFVARYLNDGLLAYFGYPRADEDDAGLAVQAGLALLLSNSEAQDCDFPLRIGIASGTVVIGQEQSADENDGLMVVGKPVMVAEHASVVAASGSLVISDGTRRLVRKSFEYRDLGEVAVDESADPEHLFEIVGPSDLQDRLHMRQAAGLVRLVGRTEDLELLHRRWQEARRGEGRVVLVSGEAGIGKSRLIVAFQEMLRTESHASFLHFCSPQHRNSTLFPVIRQLERTAELESTDPPEQKLAKIEGALQCTSAELPHLAELLSISVEGRSTSPEIGARTRRERTLAALLAHVERTVRQRPTLLVYEDAHWIDPTTGELLEMIVERIKELPILVIVTARPDFQASWHGQPHAMLLAMNRLGRRDVEELVRSVAGSHVLSGELIAGIARRAEGVPLFVEELTLALLERLKAGDPDSISSRSQSNIPATLRASLSVRLDQMSRVANEVAKAGAAVEREFTADFVAKISGIERTAVAAAFQELKAGGLIQFRGVPPDASASFKHALLREAAYDRMLRADRQKLHARIVATLEVTSVDQPEASPELLARHCAAAGLPEKAIGHWERAGQRAMARFSLMEAIAHYTEALAALGELGTDEGAKRREIALQIALAEAYIAWKGYGAEQAGRAFARAHQLIQDVGAAPQLFHVLAGMFIFHEVRAEIGRSQEVAHQLLRLAEETDDIAGQALAHRDLGDSLLHAGEFLSARRHFERAVALVGPDTPPIVVGDEVGVAALAFLSLSLAMLGLPTSAVARSDEAVERACRYPHHPQTLALALNVACRLHFVLRNRHRLAECAERLHVLAVKHGLTYMHAQAALHHGRALLLKGQPAEGVMALEQGIAGVRSTGAERLLPFNLGALAVAYQETGRDEKARATVAEALERVRNTRIRWAEAELQRLDADLTAPGSRAATIEGKLRRAIATARQQGAKWWELRGSISLARFWRTHDKPEQAFDVLSPIFASFHEGFDMPDLVEARALLNDLRPG